MALLLKALENRVGCLSPPGSGSLACDKLWLQGQPWNLEGHFSGLPAQLLTPLLPAPCRGSGGARKSSGCSLIRGWFQPTGPIKRKVAPLGTRRRRLQFRPHWEHHRLPGDDTATSTLGTMEEQSR